MKDIDFDELDKAVSSVLGSGAKPKAADPAAASVAVKTTVAEAPADAKKEDVPAQPAPEVKEEPKAPAAESKPSEESPADTPKIIASPAVRRGRFMDVVHPSSDMTSTTTSSEPAAPAVIAPSAKVLKPVSTDLVAPSTPAPAAPEAAPVEPVATLAEEPKVEDAPKLDTIDTPTPLDTPAEHTGVAADDDTTAAIETKTTKADEPQAEPITPEVTLPDDEELSKLGEEAETTPAASTDEKEPVTPFLTDTKVDKRPLGAFAEDEVAPEQPAPETVASTEPLPRELSADMLNVESKEATSAATAGATQEDILQSPENTADDAQLQHMFSSEVNHSLPASKKKSSLWLWLLLAILLLAVGSGLGYLWFINGF